MGSALFGRRIFLAWAAIALLSLDVSSQTTGEASPRLNIAFVSSTVEAVAGVIHSEYFDVDLAAHIDASLREWLAAGRYANASTPEALASLLTTDLYSLTHDKHLSVAVVPEAREGSYAGVGASPQSRAEAVRVSNAAVQRVEILPGNVGYLNVTAFFHPDEAADAIASAMHMLHHADALILDMRDNGGGSPDTMALLASYCFDAPGLPLADIIPRSGEVQHYVTQSGIVDRDGTRPVYVLTSAHTWSAGEGFAYILQERHRAEIIGETTVGAANPGRPYPINAQFSVILPNSRIRTAVRGANWEGAGVIPDTPVSASGALHVAQDHALRRLLALTPKGARHDELDQELRKIEAEPSTP